MKLSHVLLCLAPTIALAVEADQVPAAVAPSPSVPNITPPIPLPAIVDEESNLALDAHHMLRMNNPADLAIEDPLETPVSEQWSGSLRGSIGLGSLKSAPGTTKSLRARSEGTLGQTPWIGMAIGLTCTALAAVMLG